MGWFGKIIGGSLGFVIGGPVGAAVGASIGAVADSTDATPQDPPLRIDGEIAEDDVGTLHTFVIHSAIPRNVAAVFAISNADGDWVQAEPGFCDEDGDYASHAPISDGQCFIYIPHIALRVKSKSKPLNLHLSIVTVQGEQVTRFGGAVFSFRPTRRGPFSKVALLRPVIDVCMAVARADGKLESSEVRLVKQLFVEQFEIPSDELSALRDAMKAPTVSDIENAVYSALFRIPDLERAHLLQLATRIAHADGHVSPEEVAVIRRIAGDVTPKQWDEIATALELHAIDHHAVLGLSPGASAAEIKQAYRSKVLQYHPDRVAALPAEFQKLAQEKTIELRSAYETLLKAVEGRGA